MKYRIQIVLGLLMSISLLIAQSDHSDEMYHQAVNFEKIGEYEKAESLYVKLYFSDPNNYTYYSRYRGTLIQERKFDELLPVIKERLRSRPYDVYLKLQLGVLYFRINDQKKAKEIWSEIFKKDLARSMTRSYAVGIYQDILEFGMGPEFYKVTDILRKITGDQELLVEYNFATSMRYRNWDAAVGEMKHILDNNPNDLRYIRSELFKGDPNSDLYQRLILLLKNEKRDQGLILLSDIYFHLNEYREAFNVLSRDHNNAVIRNAMLAFANRTYKNQIYHISYLAARWSEHYDPDKSRQLSMSLLATQSLEKIFRKEAEPRPLIPVPYTSALSDIRFISVGAEEADLIKSIYYRYDSLSVYPGLVGQLAKMKHAEITYQVFQDFDAALREYQSLLKSVHPQLRNEVLSRISDLYLALGDPASALDFLKKAPERFYMTVEEEDKLTPYMFFASIMNGNLDSLNQQSMKVLALLPLDDPMYNDILAFSSMIELIEQDSLNRSQWLSGEQYLLQNNLAKAMEVFKILMDRKSIAWDIYALRYLECLTLLKDPEKEDNFWNTYYKSLLNTDLGDYYMIKYALYLEKVKKYENAIDIFDKFLLSYRESVYYETVRQYVRQHYSEGTP